MKYNIRFILNIKHNILYIIYIDRNLNRFESLRILGLEGIAETELHGQHAEAQAPPHELQSIVLGFEMRFETEFQTEAKIFYR